MSPRDEPPDNRPAVLHHREDCLVQVNNSRHWGACIRPDSPLLALFTALLPSVGMLKAALMYSFLGSLIKSLITAGFGVGLQHVSIGSSFKTNLFISFRPNGHTSWKPMSFKMVNLFVRGFILSLNSC